MVAPFDLFGKGLYRYTFEGTCRECPELKLGDGAVKIFINTNGTNKEDFSEDCKKIRKNKTVEQIADELEADVTVVQSIYSIALLYAPGYEEDKVFDAWMKEKQN